MQEYINFVFYFIFCLVDSFKQAIFLLTKLICVWFSLYLYFNIKIYWQAFFFLLKRKTATECIRKHRIFLCEVWKKECSGIFYSFDCLCAIRYRSDDVAGDFWARTKQFPANGEQGRSSLGLFCVCPKSVCDVTLW